MELLHAMRSGVGIVGADQQGLRKKIGLQPHQPCAREPTWSLPNRQDQPSASCPFMPPSKTLSTSSAISHPAARSVSSERKPSGRGDRLLLPETEPQLQEFRPAKKQVPATKPCEALLASPFRPRLGVRCGWSPFPKDFKSWPNDPGKQIAAKLATEPPTKGGEASKRKS